MRGGETFPPELRVNETKSSVSSRRSSSIRGTPAPEKNAFSDANLWSNIFGNIREPRNATFLLAVLCVITTASASTITWPAKQQLLVEFGEDMHSFERRDSFAFYLAGVIFAPIMGYFAGIVSRRHLFLVLATVGGLAVILTGVAINLEMYYFLRFVAGFSYGATHPVCASLIGDLFDSWQRQKVAGMVVLSIGFGTACGLLVTNVAVADIQSFADMKEVAIASNALQVTSATGSTVLQPLSIWIRLVWAATGLTTIASGVLMFLFGSEPPRGQFDVKVVSAKPTSRQMRTVFSWTNLLCLMTSFPGLMPFAVIFAKFKELSLGNTHISIFAFSGFIGILVAAQVGTRLRHISDQLPAAYSGVAVMLRMVPGVLVASGFVADHPGFLGLSVMAVYGFITAQNVPFTSAVILNANTPGTRGLVASVHVLAEDVSRALAPLFFQMTLPDHYDNQKLRTYLTYWMVVVYFLVGLSVFLIAWTERSDMANVKQILEEELDESVRAREKAQSQERISINSVLTAEAFRRSIGQNANN